MFVDELLEAASFEPGHQLGAYTLLERLGYGGEAVVWSAWDSRQKRVVALKFMLAPPGAPLSEQAELLREVQAVVSLRHPHILPLYDAGATGKHRYLVMRYVCGGSLLNLLEPGPLPPSEVLSLGAQVATALDYVHASGYVHRDIKPSNVLLDSQKHTFLTDFGLTKQLSDTTRPLHTGHGTAPYSPPEQHAMSGATRASDIYSFGILMYEMLTGKLPWDGQVALGVRQLNSAAEIPDPRDANPVLPGAVAGALRKLTAADPEARPTSALVGLGLIAGAFPDEDAWRSEHLTALDDSAWAAQDARFLLERGLAAWGAGAGKFPVSLTHFIFLNAFYAEAERHNLTLDEGGQEFMLRGALAYGQRVEFWKKRVQDPEARLAIVEQTFAHEDDAAAARALNLLLDEPAAPPRSENILNALIELSAGAPDAEMRHRAVESLNLAVQPAAGWRPVGFTPTGDEKLATLALGEGRQAVRAAQLIGQARSQNAVQVLLRAQDGPEAARSLHALTEVRDAAGSLPTLVPAPLKLRVGVALGRRQLLEDRGVLLRAYLAAGLGSVLGIGFHVYATYRLPSFLDSARILNAVGSGLLFGLVIGFGVFLTQLIVQRLRVLPPVTRMALGVLLGGLTMNAGFVGYHRLFLGAAPQGPLIALGAFVMALGFGAGGALAGQRWARALLGVTGVGLGLSLSWQLALRTALSPVLYYEVSRPAQTALLIGVSSLLIGAVAYRADMVPESAEVDSADHSQLGL